MLKIVHAADVHLDTPYVRRDDALRTRLQEAGGKRSSGWSISPFANGPTRCSSRAIFSTTTG